jgi:hypothetical protein
MLMYSLYIQLIPVVNIRLAGSDLLVAVHLRRSIVLSVCCQRQQPMRHRMLSAEQNLGHVQFGYTLYVLGDFQLLSK